MKFFEKLNNKTPNKEGGEKMEEIMRNLEGLAQQEIKECKKNKTIPSGMILYIVKLIMTYRLSQ